MHIEIHATAPSPLDARSVAPQTPRTARSVCAVLAGLFSIFATSTVTDLALQAAGVFPDFGAYWDDRSLLLATAYRAAYGILGSVITARLAPRRPLAHALVLGALGLVLSTMGAVAMWDAGPAWYSLAVIASALPCAWLGGRLGSRVATGQARSA